MANTLREFVKHQINVHLRDYPALHPVFLEEESRIAFRLLDHKRTIYSKWSCWLSREEVSGGSSFELGDELRQLLGELTSPPN